MAAPARLLRWILPPCCVVCRRPARERDLCDRCAPQLPWNIRACLRCALPLPENGYCGPCLVKPPPWQSATIPFLFEPPVDTLLRQLKFSRCLAIGRVLGELLGEWIASHPLTRPDLIVPVPLHWRRQLWRRFNQAAELARPPAKRLGVPIRHNVCRRRRSTPAQRGLDGNERRRNLRSAFSIATDLGGRHVAVVDDVVTTGSTLAELSRTLLKAGAARVDVWAIARVK